MHGVERRGGELGDVSMVQSSSKRHFTNERKMVIAMRRKGGRRGNSRWWMRETRAHGALIYRGGGGPDKEIKATCLAVDMAHLVISLMGLRGNGWEWRRHDEGIDCH